MNNLDVLGRDSNMRHSLPQADCFINNAGWWKIFLQLFYSYSKHATFPHSGWSNRWIKELLKTHCRSICFWRKTHQAYLLRPCSFRICSILRKSILQEVTNDGSKCSWLGMQAHTYGKWRNLSKHWVLMAATDIFQDFQAPGYKRQRMPGAFCSGFQVFILKINTFLSLGINEILQSLQRIWEGLEKCL